MAIAFIVNADAEEHIVDRELFGMLPEKRRKKAESYKRYGDKIRCYAAGLSAIVAAAEFSGCGPESIRLVTEEWKAPFAYDSGNRKICLSISHSGALILCCADSEACGADAEVLRGMPKAIELAERFFDPSEAAEVCSAPMPERVFIEYWTMKEAYVKYLGEGLSRRLDSFSCKRNGELWTICDREIPDAKKLLCHSFSENGCQLSFVTKSNITEVFSTTLSQLEEHLKKLCFGGRS